MDLLKKGANLSEIQEKIRIPILDLEGILSELVSHNIVKKDGDHYRMAEDIPVESVIEAYAVLLLNYKQKVSRVCGRMVAERMATPEDELEKEVLRAISEPGEGTGKSFRVLAEKYGRDKARTVLLRIMERLIKLSEVYLGRMYQSHLFQSVYTSLPVKEKLILAEYGDIKGWET